jgi:hypothetical protein
MQIINNIHHYLEKGQVWYQRSVNKITVLTVHHTASLGENQTHEQILNAIYKEHVSGKGWPGISYHEVIMPDGTVYQLNEFTDVTWQDTHNFDSYAICLVGYFHTPYNQEPTAAQLVSLRKRLDDLCTNHPEFPASQGDVLGHRDRYATACPGDNLYPKVKQYRDTKGNVDWGVEENQQEPPVVQEEKPAPPPAPPTSMNTDATKRYTQSEMDTCLNDRVKFWRERDILQKEVDDTSKELHDLRNQLTPFTVSGYNTIDDVTKTIAKLTKERDELYKENQKLLSRIGILAGQVEQVSTEDSKTAEIGQGHIEKNQYLSGLVEEFAKELQAKSAEPKAIFSRIFELRDQAEQWLKTLPDDDDDNEGVVENLKKAKTDGLNWLMNMFHLSKGEGGDQRGK